jgi:hypothetical protein
MAKGKKPKIITDEIIANKIYMLRDKKLCLIATLQSYTAYLPKY